MRPRQRTTFCAKCIGVAEGCAPSSLSETMNRCIVTGMHGFIHFFAIPVFLYLSCALRTVINAAHPRKGADQQLSYWPNLRSAVSKMWFLPDAAI